MASAFETLVQNLQNLGFYDFLLPWLFTFAIVYGLLVKANIFGKNDKISGVIALVAAFFVTAVSGPAIAAFFATIFGGASIILTGILVIILLAVILGFEANIFSNLGKEGKYKYVTLAIVLILGVALFLTATGAEFLGVNKLADSSTLAMVFVLILIVLMVYIIVGGNSGGGAPAPAEKK
jgi:O-antigen/teichoic acid export membrane protein